MISAAASLARASVSGAEVARVGEDARGFESFVFPQRRARLAELGERWFAIGARWRGAPVGMALAWVGPKGAWLDSVMVASQFRRKGIGSALLEALSDHLRGAGVPAIETQYSSFLQGRSSLEGLLTNCGWGAPKLIDIQLVGLAGTMAEGGGAWGPVRRTMRDMGEYSVDPFVVGEGDDASIDALLASAPELGLPDPRKCAVLEPEVSVALRRRGELIGWIIGERLTDSRGFGTLAPDSTSILYTTARIGDGHRRTVMLAGYHRAFSRQAEVFGPQSRAVYRTHPAAKAMYAFTRTRFAPMALHLEERFGASLALADNPTLVTPQESLAC